MTEDIGTARKVVVNRAGCRASEQPIVVIRGRMQVAVITRTDNEHIGLVTLWGIKK